MYAEVYSKSQHARDGMSGALNYSVLMDVAKNQGIKDMDDLLFYAGEVETLLREKNKASKG